MAQHVLNVPSNLLSRMNIGKRFFTSTISNSHKLFFEKISKELGLKTWQDWYKVKRRDLESKGALPVLVYYDNSHIEALVTLFPHNDWKIWKFNQVPTHFWQQKSNQRKFFENLAKELDYNKFEDWYSISIRGTNFLHLLKPKIFKNMEAQDFYPIILRIQCMMLFPLYFQNINGKGIAF